MLDVNQQVRGQLIPLRGMNLILPNTCIAEVVGFSEVLSVNTAPEWLLGMLDWRGRRIPVICFEVASKQAGIATDITTQVAILNSITGNHDLPFYGLAIQGIPHLLTLNSTNINAITRPDQSIPLALQQVMIGDQVAIIPDLDKLEILMRQDPVSTVTLI